MHTFYFTLSLQYEFCERLYAPGINKVVITADNGKRVQLPVKNLRLHISSIGINGRFRLMIDENNKIKSFEKMS